MNVSHYCFQILTKYYKSYKKKGSKRAECVWSLHCHVPKGCNTKYSATFRKFKFVLEWEKNCCLILANKRCRSTSLQYTHITLHLNMKAFWDMNYVLWFSEEAAPSCLYPEVGCSMFFETLVPTMQTTQCHIPDHDLIMSTVINSAFTTYRWFKTEALLSNILFFLFSWKCFINFVWVQKYISQFCQSLLLIIVLHQYTAIHVQLSNITVLCY